MDNSLIIKLGLDTADSKKRVTELNKELKSLDKQIKSLDTSTEDFETNMTNMGKKIDLAKTSIVGLTEKLEEQNKQLDKAGERLEKARKELEDFRNSGEQNAKTLKELENRVNSAQSSYNKLQREVTDTKLSLEKATASLSDMEKQLKKMSFDELTKDFDSVVKNVDKMKQSMESLESTLRLQNQAVQNTESYLRSLEQQFEKYRNSTDATTDGIQRFEREINQTKATIEELRNEMKTTERTLDSTEQEFKEMENVLNRLSLDKLNKEIESLDTNTDSFNRNIQNMSRRIELSKSSVEILTRVLQDQNRELDESRSHLEQVQREYDQYRNNVDRTADGMRELEQRLSRAETSFNELQKEVNETGQELLNTTQDISKMAKEIENAKLERLSDTLGNIGDKLGNFAEATAPLSGALAGIGTVGITSFIKMEGSLTKLKNMLGSTDAEAERLYESAKKIASEGFAEFNDVLDVVSNVKLMLGETLNDKQIEDFSRGVLALSQTFDADLNDILKASNMMMTNFGIEGEKALDIIGWGFQNGLNYSDDFLDTLWEYSVQFADMGYSAEEFASILEQGMKNGVFNTDKLADAVKEANIRLKEMPEATGEAVKNLGLDVTKIQSDIAKGGDVAQKAMENVCQAIMSIEDPVERNKVGVEVFGTMWEDTGEAIAQSIINVTDSIDGLSGTTDEMNNAIKNMSDGGLAELKVQLSNAFEIIGEKLYPVFSTLIDKVIDGVEWFSGLSESVQGFIIYAGLMGTAISPLLGTLSKLSDVALWAVTDGAKKANHAINLLTHSLTDFGKSKAPINVAQKMDSIKINSEGVVASLGRLATSMLPVIITAGAFTGILTGVVVATVNAIKMYDEMQTKQRLLAEGYEGDVARMGLANSLLVSDFNTKFGEAKTNIDTFSSEASSLLAQAFANLGAEGSETAINLDEYNALIARKLDETKTTIETHQQEMQSDLALFNSNYADQTVLGWDVINTITENKGKDMNKHVQTAYDNLINTQKMSAYVGQTITDEAGNEMVYTWEMYYDDLQKAQSLFEEESLKAQVGFYGDELFNTQTFVRDVGATKFSGYQEQLKDAEQQRDDMIKVSEEQRDEQLKVIQQLSDEELEILGYTREDLVEIAVLQHEQVVNEAEGLYHDAVAEYTSMAEDSARITDEQREYTIKSHKGMKEDCIAENQEMQKRIDEILNDSAGDFKDYTGTTGKEVAFVAKNIDQMSTRVYGSLVDMNGNFITSANTVDRETNRIQSDINSIQGKSVDVTVKFQSINFQAVRQQVESMGSHVYSAGISSYKDYLDGLPTNFGTDYAQDLYGLKDAGVRTISLANLGMDEISAVAGKDGGSIVSGAVANYNYNNSYQNIKNESIIKEVATVPKDKEINITINIENMGGKEQDVKDLVKQIDYYMRVHGKRW